MLLVLGQARGSRNVWTEHTPASDPSLNSGFVVFIVPGDLGKNHFPGQWLPFLAEHYSYLDAFKTPIPRLHSTLIKSEDIEVGPEQQ